MLKTMNLLKTAAVMLLVLHGAPFSAYAWDKHNIVTGAALDILPDAEKWKTLLGDANYSQLPFYSLMPDIPCQDLGTFYTDDYILFREMPFFVEHRVDPSRPNVKNAVPAQFGRACQALRTETPAEACRHIGPLLHYIQDAGSPPHAKPTYGPAHGFMENWIRAELIAISGYKPVILGANEEEALKGLLAKLDGLIAFSAARAERILPLVEAGEDKRPEVEPVVLESALESARFSADVLHTLFNLCLTSECSPGAGIEGKIAFKNSPAHGKKGARIILLDEKILSSVPDSAKDPSVFFDASTKYTTFTDAEGRYKFRNLPGGSYRILAYRAGSMPRISETMNLTGGNTVMMNLELPAAEPQGNLILNPSGTLFHLWKDRPDYWFKNTGWQYPGNSPTSEIVWLPQNTGFRCGVVFKDPEARAEFQFRETLWGKPVKTLKFAAETANQEEQIYNPGGKRMFAVAVVETLKPLHEAIENVWLVPEN